mmetsp:Transcript_26839/g.61887  ORF Transcript_26839/g.61887 Transcript_26839/m.61887 type:complete len:625 (+) Transcript_26839:407-2281(+)
MFYGKSHMFLLWKPTPPIPQAQAGAEVEQIVGEPGDVILLHPWLIHSGTDNRSSHPRVLYNGMARVRESVFAQHGVMTLSLLGRQKNISNTPTNLSAVGRSSAAEPFGGDAPARRGAEGAAGGEQGTPRTERVQGSKSAEFKSAEFKGEAAVTEDEKLLEHCDWFCEEERLLEPPPKRRLRRTAEAMATEVSLLAAQAKAAGACSRAAASESFPLVSIIVPAHNAMTTLDAALESVLCQDYCGRVQVSLFDDASTDGTAERIAHWLARLNANGFETVASGSRWQPSGNVDAKAGGIGFAKNRAVAQSEGAVLIFLDSDDIMLPARISQQVLALSQSPRAIVGGAWRRLPDGATAHYESWANSLSPERLWLEQFRETTLQMPTWAIRRETFARVGGFVEKPAEDLAFFLKHLDDFPELLLEEGGAVDAIREEGTHAAALVGPSRSAEGLKFGRIEAMLAARLRADPPLVRVGSREEPLLLYRWSASSMTSTVSRRELLAVRVAAFERRVLTLPSWEAFTVWGAGRDGRQFVSALSPAARARVLALADIDPKKVGSTYTNHRLEPPLSLPIIHVREMRPPVVVCVSLRRADESAADNGCSAQPTGEIARAASELGLVEGRTVWYFF